ncbi:TIR domain-containing protein [Pseudomonas koreensis]
MSEFGEPYIDLIHNTAENKQAHVENNLLKSDILILISSESVSKSNWVLWELKKAKLLGIPVIKISANEEDVPNIPTMLRIELNKLASN